MAPKSKKAAAAPKKQKSKTSEADEVSAAIIKHIDNLLTEDQDDDEVADYCGASCAAHCVHMLTFLTEWMAFPKVFDNGEILTKARVILCHKEYRRTIFVTAAIAHPYDQELLVS